MILRCSGLCSCEEKFSCLCLEVGGSWWVGARLDTVTGYDAVKLCCQRCFLWQPGLACVLQAYRWCFLWHACFASMRQYPGVTFSDLLALSVCFRYPIVAVGDILALPVCLFQASQCCFLWYAYISSVFHKSQCCFLWHACHAVVLQASHCFLATPALLLQDSLLLLLGANPVGFNKIHVGFLTDLRKAF